MDFCNLHATYDCLHCKDPFYIRIILHPILVLEGCKDTVDEQLIQEIVCTANKTSKHILHHFNEKFAASQFLENMKPQKTNVLLEEGKKCISFTLKKVHILNKNKIIHICLPLHKNRNTVTTTKRKKGH